MSAKPMRKTYARRATTDAEVETQRKSRMGAIAVMAKQLDMDEETLRSMMQTTVGKTSRREMSLSELTHVRDALVAKGAKLTAPGGKGRKLATDAQAGKLRALWQRGHALGILRDGSESAMCSWASNSRSPNVTALLQAFTGAEFDRAIERLKQWLARTILQGRFVCPSHGPVELPSDYRLVAAKAVIQEVGVKCPHCANMLGWEAGKP